MTRVCNLCKTPLLANEGAICKTCRGWQVITNKGDFSRLNTDRMGLPPKRMRRFVP